MKPTAAAILWVFILIVLVVTEVTWTVGLFTRHTLAPVESDPLPVVRIVEVSGHRYAVATYRGSVAIVPVDRGPNQATFP